MSDNYSPLVSIITPTFNHERFIGPCIDSVLQQTYPNWEQIIIDDGSTDQTAEIIRTYADPRIRYVHQENRGIEALPHTYNYALCKSQGELVAILEGDDLWPADKLSKLVPAFDDARVVLAYGAVSEVSADGTPSRRLGRAIRRRRKLPRSILFNDPVGSASRYMLRADGMDLVPASTAVIRRSTLDSIGGFQYFPDLCVTDFPTFICLSLKGNFHYTPCVLGHRRRHPESSTFRNLARIGRRVREYAEIFCLQHDLELTAEERRTIEKTYRRSDEVRGFTAGRLCLVDREWKQARFHFWQALSPSLSRECLAALVGWVLSWFHTDLERLLGVAGLATLKDGYMPQAKEENVPSKGLHL